MESNNLVNTAISELVDVFSVFKNINTPQRAASLAHKLGYELPGEELISEVFPNLFNTIDDLTALLSQIEQSQSDEDKLKLLSDLLQLIIDCVNYINTCVNSFPGIFQGLSPDLIDEIVDKLPKRLLDHILITYLQHHRKQTFSILLFLGIIKIESDIVKPISDPNVQYFKKSISWSSIPDFFIEPGNSIKEQFNWIENQEIEIQKLFQFIELILQPFNTPYTYSLLEDYENEILNSPSDSRQLIMPLYFRGKLPDNYTELGLGLSAYCSEDEKPKGIGLYPYITGNADLEYNFCPKWKGTIATSGDLDNGMLLLIKPPFNINFVQNLFTDNLLDNIKTTFEVGLARTSVDESLTYLFGSEKGSHLALKEAGVKIKASSQRDKPEFSATLSVKDFTIAINPGSDGDGFIQKLLSGINIKSVSDLGIGVSNLQGIYFEGSSALEINIPTHIELGPINIESATVGVSFEDRNIGILLASSFSADMGPLFASVERMGLTIPFSFPEDGKGNLGPVQIKTPKFLPPKGVALSIDAGVVKGGGYLFIDADRGEYAGALELTFSDFLSLKAIGLINTKMPDGSKGFSLLVIITAEFTIQIGMGFVFLGAGGLLGLHRTAKLTPLAEGVRTGATANILFPTNIVENAQQIISDIKTFFPIEENHFLIGPMIKLGWGQPALVSVSLGIIIEIKTDNGGSLERIAILGVLKCKLPDEEKAVLVLQVNFIGAVDFTKKTGFFFASMFESRVLAFTIEGEMGLLVAWGNDANFLISVGGFHPMFNPPPLPFPVPKRIAISLLNKSWGKIRAEGYFAVTTNTVQFGTRIEVKFGLSKCEISGHLAFDALFQFSPFYFIVEISGKVSLKVFGAGLFSISLKFSLQGPTPWRAKGYGKIKILFITIKARFDKKWGQSKNTQLPPIEVLDLLYQEFNNAQNWETIAPASNKILVSMRDFSQQLEANPDLLLLHPGSQIKLSQRLAPLKKKFDKIGNQKPADANHFDLQSLTDFLSWGDDTKESFAPAQFFDMKPGKKLSEPATRKYISGSYIKAGSGELKTNAAAVRHVRYELITIDNYYKRVSESFYRDVDSLFSTFLGNNAASKSVLSHRHEREYQPFDDKISVREGNYTVAYAMNNKPYNESAMGFDSPWEAEAFINSEIENNPLMASGIHVIPTNEANTIPV